jgi:hypothetical protein
MKMKFTQSIYTPRSLIQSVNNTNNTTTTTNNNNNSLKS